MQISNNQTNLNFNGAFKIKPSELKAQTEIPARFTQGMQKFTNIEEKGDMFIVALPYLILSTLLCIQNMDLFYT